MRSAARSSAQPAISASIPFDPETLRFDGIVRRHLEIMTGAGIVAGLIYWMIAGRSAGAWREPPPLRPPPPLPSHSAAGVTRAAAVSHEGEQRVAVTPFHPNRLG